MVLGLNRKFIKISSPVFFIRKSIFMFLGPKFLKPRGDFNNFKQVRCENNEHSKADDQGKHRNYSESPVTTSQIAML